MPRRRRAARIILLAPLLLTSCPGPLRTPSGPPVPGGVLRVAVRDLGTLDPAKATGRGALLAVRQIFESLTKIDPRTNEAVPAAASSWDVSGDGRTWTFHLAPRAFQDGRPVTARDFKFAFDRLVRKETGSPSAYQLEAVKGFRDAKIAGTARSLKGAEAPAADRLVLRLDHPFFELPVAVAHPALAPLEESRFATNAALLDEHPAANGPYLLASITPGQSAVLTRNDSYRGASGLVDRIELKVVRDFDEGWRDYLAGEVDLADVPPTAIESERGRYGEGGSTAFWAALYLGFNLRQAKWAKPEVRRALSLAIDRSAIARNVYGGTTEPATGLIPRGVRGFSPDACGGTCVPDRERAAALVAAAFRTAPLEVAIDYPDALPYSQDIARAVAVDLGGVGVKATIRAHSPRDYGALLDRRGQDFAESAWTAAVPGPDPFLAQLRTGSADNQVAFSDPAFDSLLDKARAERDDRKRLDLYRQAEARALEALPLVPVVFYRNHLAVARRVQGLSLDGAGLFDAASVWLSQR